jgi:hypothetical protein
MWTEWAHILNADALVNLVWDSDVAEIQLAGEPR